LNDQRYGPWLHTTDAVVFLTAGVDSKVELLHPARLQGRVGLVIANPRSAHYGLER
jgi:hypothetical protein